jgi:hypothetical protein
MKTRLILFAAAILLVVCSCGKNEDQFDNQLTNKSMIRTGSENMSEKELVNAFAVDGSRTIEVTLNWDSSADIDLYVQDPMGEWIWYKHKKSQSDGMLVADDRNGFGPETVAWNDNQYPTGNYKVYVKHYGGGIANYSVTVQVCGKTRLYKGFVKSGVSKYITEFSEKMVEVQNNPIQNDELPTLQKN